MIAQAMRGDAHVERFNPVGGNDATLLLDHEEFERRVLEDIAGARHSINITQFIWTPDGSGRTVADAVMRKAREGVEVNVTLDVMGGRFFRPWGRTGASLKRELESAGVNVRVSVPVSTNIGADGSRRSAWDHRKLLVIDGRVTYTGGLALSERVKTWQDAMVRLEGPAAAQAGVEFLGRWRDFGGHVSLMQRHVLLEAMVKPRTPGDATAVLEVNSPRGDLDATARMESSAANAREILWEQNQYIGSERAVQHLIDAARRGVDVRVVLPSTNIPENPGLIHLSRTFYRDLIDAGVKVYEKDYFVHAKTQLTEHDAFVGSLNLTDGGWADYMEIGASVRDAKVSADLARQFEEDFAASHQVTREELTGWPWGAARALRKATGLHF